MTAQITEWVQLIVTCFCFGAAIQVFVLLGRRGQP